VFVGGCSVEGAAAIAGDWPTPAGGAAAGVAPAQGRLAALERLRALVDHGLLQPGPGAVGEGRPAPLPGSVAALPQPGWGPRFVLLETVREYALERLEASGELEPACRRHALHFSALAERAAEMIHGADQADAFDLLERERGNLRAALD
jgi:hypothetical protein